MRIDSNSWHCRLYLWWYEKKYGHSNEKGFSNLCPYMRAVMFWAPLRAIFGTWVKFGPIPFNVFSIPPLLYAFPKTIGYFSYQAKFTFWIVYTALAIGAVLAGNFCLINKWFPTKERVYHPPSEFKKLVKGYLQSFHDRVCPEIDWK